MRTKTLHVRLNTASTPPVTIVEDSMAVGKHRYELQWVPDPGQSSWVFADIKQPDKVTPLPTPPFSTPSISDSQITVTDDNTESDDHGTFSYSICVKVGSTPYWSDPEIINRGGS
jgi:hypothetical protein